MPTSIIFKAAKLFFYKITTHFICMRNVMHCIHKNFQRESLEERNDLGNPGKDGRIKRK